MRLASYMISTIALTTNISAKNPKTKGNPAPCESFLNSIHKFEAEFPSDKSRYKVLHKKFTRKNGSKKTLAILKCRSGRLSKKTKQDRIAKKNYEHDRRSDRHHSMGKYVCKSSSKQWGKMLIPPKCPGKHDKSWADFYPNQCTCENGAARRGSDCLAHNSESCLACNDGFVLNAEKLCEVESVRISNNNTECEVGYIYNPNSDECDDINECEIQLTECYWKSRECVNTVGSYTCGDCMEGLIDTGVSDVCIHNPCNEGEILVNGLCDIDECSTANNQCIEQNRKCKNTVGSYECQGCLTGYLEEKHASGEDLCVLDIDSEHELPQQNSNNNKITTNCNPGYKFNQTTMNCDDINECQALSDCHWKNRNCVNIIGSYLCGSCKGDLVDDGTGNCVVDNCPEGYSPTSDGFCDANECLGPNTCGIDNRECINIKTEMPSNLDDADPAKAGYLCGKCLITHYENAEGICDSKCDDGYLFDEMTGKCEDLDECSDKSKVTECYWTNKECVNTIGSYTCV